MRSVDSPTPAEIVGLIDRKKRGRPRKPEGTKASPAGWGLVARVGWRGRERVRVSCEGGLPG